MKKLIIGIISVAILGLLAYWQFNLNSDSKSFENAEGNYAFGIKDTASIGKIVLKNKIPEEAVLVRTEKGWRVDGDFNVRKDAIEVLLETFHRMSLRHFAPEKHKPVILRRMATTGTEVETYDRQGNLINHFFVGGETQDQLGTYMMMADGDNNPYAMHIQGFNGFLSTRFFSNPIMWKDRTIFGFSPKEIDTIHVTYPESSINNFSLKVDGDQIRVWNSKNEEVEVNQTTANLFLGVFRTLKYEGAIVETDKVWEKRDSVFNSPVVVDYYIGTKQGESKSFKAYHVPAKPGELNENNEPLVHDPDRLYALISDGRFVLIQYYAMTPAFVGSSYFGQVGTTL